MIAPAQWHERECPSAAAEEALAAFVAAVPSMAGVPPVFGRLLAQRGVCAENAGDYLFPSCSRLAPPEALPGVVEAAALILDRAVAGRRITVFGDYDADGVCATAILVRTLRALVPDCDIAGFIPERRGEGYGLTDAAMARMDRERPGTELVITVDNGISAVREVGILRGRGVAVVVTDHHLPGADVPAADVLVDPKVASAPETRDLCGAGVAFFLARALSSFARERGIYSGRRFAGPLLVLAGLATVTDAMPLTAQNRALVSDALRYFDRYPVPGLRELVQADSVRPFDPTSTWCFGWFIGPRLNAAGRMASAREAYELLLTDDRERARNLAVQVKQYNALRHEAEARMMAAAEAQVEDGAAAQVVAGTDWELGVSGIVASRICEKCGVPAAVVVVGPDGAGLGSSRAGAGYNLHDALDCCADLLVRFGGHAQAAGFTVAPGRLDEFRARFRAACAEQGETAPSPAPEFDAWVEPGDLTLELARAVRRMEPFGEANPEPLLGLRAVALANAVPLRDRHLAVEFADRGLPRAVWWGRGQEVEELRRASSARFDALVKIKVSEYGGDPHPELEIVAMRPSVG